MILHNELLGEIRVEEESILYLPDGLLGFDELKRYLLAEVEEYLPFLWLIPVEEPRIGFAIADPKLFYGPPYEVALSQADREVLDLQAGDTVSVFVIVSTADAGRRITANLKGPVVLNTRNRLGKQVVVYSPSYSVRQSPLVLQEQVPLAAVARSGRVSARG